MDNIRTGEVVTRADLIIILDCFKRQFAGANGAAAHTEEKIAQMPVQALALVIELLKEQPAVELPPIGEKSRNFIVASILQKLGASSPIDVGDTVETLLRTRVPPLLPRFIEIAAFAHRTGQAYLRDFLTATARLCEREHGNRKCNAKPLGKYALTRLECSIEHLLAWAVTDNHPVAATEILREIQSHLLRTANADRRGYGRHKIPNKKRAAQCQRLSDQIENGLRGLDITAKIFVAKEKDVIIIVDRQKGIAA